MQAEIVERVGKYTRVERKKENAQERREEERKTLMQERRKTRRERIVVANGGVDVYIYIESKLVYLVFISPVRASGD